MGLTKEQADFLEGIRGWRESCGFDLDLLTVDECLKLLEAQERRMNDEN